MMDVGQVTRVAVLRVYIEECSGLARLADHEGDDERHAWWAGEELAARGALLEAERA